MPITPKVYGQSLLGLVGKDIDWMNDSVRVMLTTSAYAPNQDTHDFASDVTNEVSGPGYTAGGQLLSGKTQTYDSATNTLTLDCDDITWAASTLTARYAVFYVDSGSAATSPLLLYWDFGADLSSASGPFILTISAAGLLTLTVP